MQYKIIKQLIEKLYLWSVTDSDRDHILKKIKALPTDKLLKLNVILDHVIDLNWQTVILDPNEFKQIVESSDFVNKANISADAKNPISFQGALPANGQRVLVKDLPSQEMRESMLSMGFYDDDEVLLDFVEDFYDSEIDESGLVFSGGNGTGLSNAPFSLSNPVPQSGMRFGMQSVGMQDDIDSVFNFAVVYIYGSKTNNVVTVSSVDVNKRLYVHEQQQFTIKTIADVIEVCELLDKKYNLDKIYFVETDNAKTITNYVSKGLTNQEISVETLKELVSFKNSVESVPGIVGEGQVLMLNGPWVINFQKEIASYFGQRTGMMPTMGSQTYPRLKSLTYTLDLWENNKDTQLFTRDYGLNQKDN